MRAFLPFRLLSLSLAFSAACATRAQLFNDLQNVPSQASTPKDVRVEQRLGQQVPTDVSFKDQSGKTSTVSDILNGRPAIFLPIFYRCHGVCTLEMNNLIGTIEKMKDRRVGKDYEVIVLSVDPQEGPALALDKFNSTLQTFPDFKGTEAGWHFLTGDLQSIRAVTDSLGFYFEYDPKTDLVNHPSGIMFLTPSGQVSGYVLSANYSPQTFERDLATAQASVVGPKSDDAFFGCIHTDPVTGKRSLVIQKVLALAGYLTVALVAALVVGLSVRRGRKA